MARYTGAVCRFCRREGMKLFLKGRKMLHRQMCSHPHEGCSRNAWAEQKEAV